jgi:hypothetical protein
MLQPGHRLFTVLGFRSQGDIGPLTMYTSKRRRLVVYLQAPPKTPPTRRQLHQRAKLLHAAFLWRTLSLEEKATWSRAARKAHLRISGYNLYIFSVLTLDPSAAATVARQAHCDLHFPGETL